MNQFAKKLCLLILCGVFLAACSSAATKYQQDYQEQYVYEPREESTPYQQRSAFDPIAPDALPQAALDAIERGQESQHAQQVYAAQTSDIRTTYVTYERMGNRRYLFQEDNPVANSTFITQSEGLIYALLSFAPVEDLTLSIFMTDIREETGIRLSNQVAISFEDAFGFGVMTHRMGQRILPNFEMRSLLATQLPFWLSTGIESVARSKMDVDIFNPISDDVVFFDDFGDLYFFPQIWGTAEHHQAINIAYHFTIYLLENGYFDTLTNAYASGNRQAADALAQRLFYDFSGLALDTYFVLRPSVNTMYTITMITEHSHIDFLFETYGQQMATADDLRRHGAEMNEASGFVMDWFDNYIDHNFRIPIHVVFAEMDGSLFSPGALGEGVSAAGMAGTFVASYFGLWEDMRPITAHETTHLMDGQLGSPSFAPFLEGLAGFLENPFTPWEEAGELWAEIGIEGLPGLHGISAFMISQGLFGDLFGFGNRYTPNMHHYISYLNSYTTSASFVQYIIEAYGAEKYLQVHWNVNNFANVFGISLEEMVERWLEFLGQ